nr:MAG: polyprotein [Leptosphaeria biglobosa betaflexivirus 3]
MGENFSNSRLGQIRRFLLMGSLIPTSTMMLGASKEKLQILLKDSRSISQSQSKAQKGQWQSISHSLMISRGRLLLSKMITSASYIIQLSSSLSLGFLIRLVKWRGNSLYLMREQLESKLPSKKGSLSILAGQIGHITSTALIPLCQSLIHISLSLSNYALNFLALTSSLGHTASLSILESCTDFSITQMMDSVRTKLDKISFKNFKQPIRSQIYKALSTSMNYVFMRTGQFRILVTERLSLLNLMVFLGEGRKRCLESGSIGLTQFLNKLGQFNSRLMKNFLDFLDRVLLESLGEFLLGYQRECFESFWLERQERMSIKNLLENEMKEGIQDYVWRNVIDSTNQMNMSPAVGTNLTQELAERKAFILRHFFKYLAGNLAVEGTSEQTKYPDHTIRLPPIPAARLGGTENLALEMNMVETIGAMRAWRDSLPANHPNRNATLRQMATPFADHALEFLVEHANDVKTNLAASHPELAKAPEVAFDFAKGLSPRHTVHALRAQTIGAFTGRTFRTEGQKGVFTAQGTVNVSYDG